jgi:hypothetical protein
MIVIKTHVDKENRYKFHKTFKEENVSWTCDWSIKVHNKHRNKNTDRNI